MKISLFKNAKVTVPESVLSIDEFCNGIIHGKWEYYVRKIREAETKDEVKGLKEQLPAVTISGTFSQRNQRSLITHSGFICIDIDNFKGNVQELKNDQYTYFLFTSASGRGIAIIVRINKDKHQESFQFLRKYYIENYNVHIDPAPQNIASLRFVSYDDKATINIESKVSKTYLPKKEVKKQTLPIVLAFDQVGDMVREACTRGVDLAPDYESYLRLGFALAHGFGSNGREYFHALCSMSTKYNQEDADKQFNVCLDKKNNPGITVGSFYHMLKENGISIPKGNDRAIRLAAMAKRTGRKKEGIVEQLVKIENVDEVQAGNIVDQVFAQNITLANLSKDPEKLIETLSQWLIDNHPMRRNVITGIIEDNGQDLSKEKLNSIYLRAKSVFNTTALSFDLVERFVFSEFTPDFHPIREYIDKNRHRNSTGNIDLLISSIQNVKDYERIYIRRWLISLMAAVDGHPVRSVLSFVGPQNTGKTEFFRRLLPKDLKKYYAESKLDAGKDDDILMCQKLIVMDDEMGGKSKQDAARFKELTSKSIFSLRAPYGRHNQDFKRLAVLCGTSNHTEIINDTTGNTRILPVEIFGLDHDKYNAVDKDELFMELVMAYEAGEDWQLRREELTELSDLSNSFEAIPYERELILEHFSTEDQGGYVEWLSATEIKNVIELNSKQMIKNINKFGQECKKVFGKSKSIKVSGFPVKKYPVVRNNLLPTTIQSVENQIVPF
jgi:predicted P-loop ATPase